MNQRRTILIDDTLATSFLTIPISEGWVENDRVLAAMGMTAKDITVDDVALIPAALATRLVETHVIDRSVAVVHEGIGMTSLWTPERADEIEEAAIWLAGVGLAGETLTRALLKPYFGIQATSFTQRGEPPVDAEVVICDGVSALVPRDDGFTEDLVRSWFIMTGWPFVSHVAVVGVRALARDADEQLEVLRTLVETGHERRRDIRRMIHESSGVDRDRLADVTGRMRYHMEPEDAEPARRLVETGTWGTAFGRSLPAYRDQLPSTTADQGEDEPDE